MSGVFPAPGGGARNPSAQALSRQINQQITHARSWQELVQVMVVQCHQMNTVNFCTTYHRFAKHVQDSRSAPENWPAYEQEQLGGALSQLNATLLQRVGEIQGHNLGLTLWAISKTYKLPQEGVDQLLAALQVEVTFRLQNVSHDTYMTDRHYNFGAQSLSNIIYSAASMGQKADYDLLHAVARAVEWEVEQFRPQGLANVIWGLGKMGAKVTHEVRHMVQLLCDEALAQLTHAQHKGSFSAQNISNMLHGLVNLAIHPSPEFLSALVRATDSMLLHFGPQELTNTAWALSQMHRSGVPFTPDVQALLHRITDEVSMLLGDRGWRARVKPQTISNLANAYAHLGQQPLIMMQDLLREAIHMLPQFKPQELSNLLWSMAAMDYYPGPTVMDPLSRAAGSAASRMKAQEVASTCWAWATLRFFPGAAIMDAMLAAAEPQLERFKSQELGMMCWAFAKLAYMPAAALVRASLPHITAWRAPIAQDCGNMLWAFAVLDILTPDVMQLLAGKLLELPRETFTQETYIQLYQAKMSLSQQVHSVAGLIPPELLAQAETEWRQQSSVIKVSHTHKDVANVMRDLRIDFEVEKKIEDGLLSVDIALRNEMVAVEVDGTAHWTQNEPYVPLGRTIWRWRCLASRGWRLVSVPYFRWAKLESLAAKKQYLYQLLQCHTVWDCLSLDPTDRDAPFRPPANLAHLTPDEVFQLAAEGIAPSSLLPPTPVAGGASCPATPLPAGLGPAAVGSTSGGSALLLPAAGLQQQRPYRSSGLPSNGTPPQVAALSSQSAPVSPYGRLPDSLYTSNPTASSGLGATAGRPSTAGGLAAAGSGRLAGGGGGGGLNVSARPFTFGGAGAGGSSGSGYGATSAVPRSSSRPDVLGSPVLRPGSQLRSASPSPLGPSFGGSSGSLSLASTAPAFSPGAAAFSPGAAAFSPATARSGSTGAPASELPGSSAPPSARTFNSLSGGSSLTSPSMGPFGSTIQLPPVPGLLSGLPAQLQQQQLKSPQLQALGLARADSPSLSAGQGLSAGLGPSSDQASEASSVTAGAVQLPGVEADSDDEHGDLRSLFSSVVGLSQPATPAGPLSVETVRTKLALLPPDRSVADEAPAWLSDWQPGMVVQLLLLLDSPTTAARAVQLFEWLRALPPEAPLAHLCTPSTYAAMIALYGRWRKPKAAVRLFAELKDRGQDSEEVHSALVEAFCRAGQPEVALDAFRHMAAQGHCPSAAAFRALLDAQLAKGGWEEADGLLASMVEQHSEALDVKLLNGVIERACAAGNPAAAQSAFNHLCRARLAPTAATFAPLLTALQRQHPAQDVAELAVGLADQADEACGAPGLGMQAVLEACRARGWCSFALQLLAALESLGRSLTVEQIDGALAACAAGGAVGEAQEVFAKLAVHELQPSPASHAAMAAAWCAAGQWADAVLDYEVLLHSGTAPTEAHASLIVDVLWRTGLPWAQAKARQLFDQATRAGWLPPAEATAVRSLLRLDLRALHVGTAQLRMHAWLQGLRAAIGNTNARCVLDETAKIVVLANDGERDAALAAQLKAELGASLVERKSPFKVSYEGAVAKRIESSTELLRKWLFSERYEEWQRAFGGHDAMAATGAAAGDVEARLVVEAQLAEEAAQSFSIVREYEAAQTLDAAAVRRAAAAPHRADAVQAARVLAFAVQPGGTEQLWHSAVVLLDRCAAAGYQPHMPVLLAAACVALAAQAAGLPFELASLAARLDREMTVQLAGAEPEPALHSEVQAVAAALQGNTGCISAMHCLKIFADRMQCDLGSAPQVQALLGDAVERLHGWLAGELGIKHPPSLQAAAALYLGRKGRGAVPFWPSVLRTLTGYREDVHPEFSALLRELLHIPQYGRTEFKAEFS